jgi:F-type H+-transporting ATPase subunit epsilon
VKLAIISPERVVFEGDVDRVVVPAFDGEVGILARHAPLIALLGRGDVRLAGGPGAGRRFAVQGGFVQVADDVVRVVTESASDAQGMT